MSARPHNEPMTAEYGLTLKRLAKGGRIEAERTYPHPHKYHVTYPTGTRYMTLVSPGCVATLLEDGYIVPRSLDERHDRINYTITDAGHAASTVDAFALPDDQLGMFDGVAA